MPMERVKLRDAISKAELHRRFREWLDSSDEDEIGGASDQRTAWIYVKHGNQRFKFHSDTKRRAVTEYMGLVTLYGDDIQWSLTENRNGTLNAVAFGANRAKLDNTLYVYLVEPAKV